MVRASSDPMRLRSSSGPEKAFWTVTCWSSAKPMSSASGSAAISSSASRLPVNGRWSGGTGRLMDPWYASRATPPPSPDYDPRMTKPPPFADETRPLAIRVGNLFDVDAGEARSGHARSSSATPGSRPSRCPATGRPTTRRTSTSRPSPCSPGSIDTHSHLVGEVQTAGVPATTTSGAQDALLSVRNARVTLEAGVTTVRDLGPFRAFVDCALRDTINAGELEGPRMLCSARSSPRRGAAATSWARARHHAPGRPAVSASSRPRPRSGTASGGSSSAAPTSSSASARARSSPAAACPARPSCPRTSSGPRSWRRRTTGAVVAVHAHSDEGARRAIRAGARSVEHGSMLNAETIAMLADTDTFFSVDLFDGEWALEHGVAERWPAETMRKLADTMDTGIAAFGEAVRRGVRVTYGTDSGVFPRARGEGPRRVVRYGMTPLNAIRWPRPSQPVAWPPPRHRRQRGRVDDRGRARVAGVRGGL